MKHTIVFGDCREVLRDTSLDLPKPSLVVTSPPYAQGLEYEVGLDYAGLWELIGETAAALFGFCDPGTYCAINFGETTKYDKPGEYAPDGAHDRTMAHLYTVTMKDAGWRIHSRRVWRKDFRRIRPGIPPVMTLPVAEFECVWTWRKPGVPLSPEKMRTKGKHLRAVWDSTGEPMAGRKDAPAPFPTWLPKQAIELWTDEGDWVLDPFLGSGSTSVAAEDMGRNSIGIEKHRDYETLIRERVTGLFNETTVLHHDSSAELAAMAM